VGVLTTEGEGRQTTGGGGLGRPAAVPGGGGAPVHFRPWEGAEGTQLDGLDLLVVLARLEDQRQRQNAGSDGELAGSTSCRAAALWRGSCRAVLAAAHSRGRGGVGVLDRQPTTGSTRSR
jgi:hypothetical protein